MAAVLLVHDDIATIAAVRRVLSRAGHEVILATSAADALIAFGHYLPEMVLLAPSVEGGRGGVVLEELAQHPSGQYARVLLLGEAVEGFAYAVVPLPLDGAAFLEMFDAAFAAPLPPAEEKGSLADTLFGDLPQEPDPGQQAIETVPGAGGEVTSSDDELLRLEEEVREEASRRRRLREERARAPLPPVEPVEPEAAQAVDADASAPPADEAPAPEVPEAAAEEQAQAELEDRVRQRQEEDAQAKLAADAEEAKTREERLRARREEITQEVESARSRELELRDQEKRRREAVLKARAEAEEARKRVEALRAERQRDGAKISLESDELVARKEKERTEREARLRKREEERLAAMERTLQQAAEAEELTRARLAGAEDERQAKEEQERDAELQHLEQEVEVGRIEEDLSRAEEPSFAEAEELPPEVSGPAEPVEASAPAGDEPAPESPGASGIGTAIEEELAGTADAVEPEAALEAAPPAVEAAAPDDAAAEEARALAERDVERVGERGRLAAAAAARAQAMARDAEAMAAEEAEAERQRAAEEQERRQREEQAELEEYAAREREERDRVARELEARAEADRLERERAEQERIEKERLGRELAEQQRLAEELEAKAAQEREERERLAAELEQARQVAEAAEAQAAEARRLAEEERVNREAAEKVRRDAEETAERARAEARDVAARAEAALFSLPKAQGGVERLPKSGIVPLERLAEIVREVCAARADVRLELKVEDVLRVLWFRAGALAGAMSSVPDESLVDRARRDGFLDAKQAAELRLYRDHPLSEQLELLCERGYLRESEAIPLVQRHTEALALEALSTPGALYRISQGGVPTDVPLAAATRPVLHLLCEALRRGLDLPSLLESVGGLRATAVRTQSLMDPAQLDLSDRERQLLGAVDGETTLERLILASGLKQDQGLRTLAVAKALGLVGFLPAPDEPEAGRPPDELDLKRLDSKLAEIRDADYFSILGVPRSAGRDEILRAYELLSAEFHPLKFAGHPDPATLTRAKLVQSALEEAAAALRDDRLRAEYARNLVD